MMKTSVIEPIFFAYMFCAFINSPLEEQLVFRKICLQHYNMSFCDVLYKSSNKTFHQEQIILQKESSQFNINSDLVKLVPAVFATIVFSMLFNKVGRKTVLILPIVGGTLQSVNLLVNSYFITWRVEFLLIGSFVDGILGQFLAMLATVNAYMSDITTETTRTKRTVMLEAMIFLSGIIASPSSGLLLQKYGFVDACFLLFALYAFQMVYWFFLKESYQPASTGDEKVLTMWEMVKKKKFLEPFQIVLKKREGGKQRMICIMATCLFLFAIIIVGFSSVTVLYMLRSPINMSPSKIGYYFGVLYACQFIGASAITYICLHKLKWSDVQVLLIFSICCIIQAVVLALCDSELKMFLSAICGLGLGVGPGAIRGKLSKLVQKHEQGNLFAFIAIFEVLLAFVFAIVFNAIYKSTIEISPAIVFYVVAGLSLIPTVIVVWLLMKGTEEDDYKTLKEEEIHPHEENGECNVDGPQRSVNA